MLLAPPSAYRSPTNQRCHHEQSSSRRMTAPPPPPLSPSRRMEDDRTLMVPKNSLSPSLFLPMDLEQADDASFQRSLLTLKPRSEQHAAEFQPRTRTYAGPVLVTPQPLNQRKRSLESEDDDDDEELSKVNFLPKKLMLCLDDH